MIEKIFVFAKAQVSSFFGGSVDYLIMIFLTEIFEVYYILSIVFGGIAGAIVNFSINKGWTFSSKEHNYKYSFGEQLLRFIFVVINSIILKASGTYCFTTFLKIDYIISRIITDLTVSAVFNYMLQRHWIFKRNITK